MSQSEAKRIQEHVSRIFRESKTKAEAERRVLAFLAGVVETAAWCESRSARLEVV